MYGYGWGAVAFEYGSARYVVEDVSYLCSPLDGLLNPAPMVLQQEPGRYELRFGWHYYDLPPEQQLDVFMGRHRKICLYKADEGDDFSVAVSANATPVWELVDEDPDGFSQAVLRLADALLALHGADRYRELWDPYCVAYPHRAVAALRAALATTDEERGW